jgi:hypothetical protein
MNGYEDKEASARHVFNLGGRSTRISENFNNSLKNHLKIYVHVVRVLKHFDRTMEVKKKQGARI